MRKVAKFGGSSLASADQFKKVGEIIHQDNTRIYVIPSAPGKRFTGDRKVTDLLLDAYELAIEGKDFTSVLDRIKARFDEIVEGLELRNLYLEEYFDDISERLATNPQRDYTASRGEYLNGIILAAYLGYEFIDAKEIIYFNEDGQLNPYKTQKVMSRRLEEAGRAVIPGFYGLGKNGDIQTFSRGGSDVTGSIVAQACKADIYENWTDVSGFLVADPRIIDNPEPIKFITYRELRELSYMGASVLHEEAIFPVRHCGIPINIRNTNRPDDEGTWIVEATGQKPDYVVTGIAGKKGFNAMVITKSMMNSEIGFGRKVLQALEDNHISFEHMPSGIDTMTVVIHADEFLEKEQKVISAIHRMVSPDSVEIETDLALIAVVGRGMRSASGTAGKLFSALAEADVNIKMIDQGSSELNIIIGVRNKDFEKSIRAIYKKFVGK